MAYEERKQLQQKPHSLSLEDRKSPSLSGVERVDSFDEQEIVMLTQGGGLIIRGSDLRMGRLDLQSGEAAVTGLISELCYEDVRTPGGFWSRIFR